MELRAKKQKAFTLIEVMIAVVIVGIMATLITPNIMKRYRKIQVGQTNAIMGNIKSALIEYKSDLGHFPTRREGGLQALTERPMVKGSEHWDGPYLSGKKEIPVDAWRNEFEYNAPPERYKSEGYRYFEIISRGPEHEADGPEIHIGE